MSSVSYRCLKCGVSWRIPDLSPAQAQEERRNCCPRCRADGQTGGRLKNPAFFLGVLAAAEAAALPVAYFLGG